MYKLKLQEYRPPERNFTKKKETRLSWFDIMHLIFRFWAKSKSIHVQRRPSKQYHKTVSSEHHYNKRMKPSLKLIDY